MQPAWRKLKIPASSEPISALRQVDGSWEELDKPGLNGFFSVVAALNWWGAHTDFGAGRCELWHAAVADVCWVMRQIIESRSADDNGNSESK